MHGINLKFASDLVSSVCMDIYYPKEKTSVYSTS